VRGRGTFHGFHRRVISTALLVLLLIFWLMVLGLWLGRFDAQAD
jgi:hypothetical protein